MKNNFIIIIIFFLGHNLTLAQSVGMNFIGFLSVNDTIEFSNYPSNSAYGIVNDTITISVPLDEVWYVQSSIFTMNFFSNNKGLSENSNVGQFCNCIALDGNSIHNAFNSKFFLMHSPSSGIYYPTASNTVAGISYLRKATDFFDVRIPLLPGDHFIARSFLVYSAYPYYGTPQFDHLMILERYQIVQ